MSSACDKSPATPTPPPAPTTHTVVVVASTKVAAERRAEGGYVYRTVLHLTETAGVTANIAAVNLTFLNGTTALLTTRFDAVVPSNGNTCLARSSVDTRELVATDTTATHAFAATVRVEVTYGDLTSTGMTANATADVPPLGPPPPSTYTLTGRISDPGSVGIPNARVEVLNGDNAGKSTTTDGSGTYTLTELLGGAFRLRASADGYNTGEQNVTVPDVPRADFTLQRISTACAYTVAPTGSIFVAFWRGSFRRCDYAHVGLLFVAGHNGRRLADPAQCDRRRRGDADGQLSQQRGLRRTLRQDYVHLGRRQHATAGQPGS